MRLARRVSSCYVLLFFLFVLCVFTVLRLRASTRSRSDDVKHDGANRMARRRLSNLTLTNRHVLGRMRMSGGRLGNEMFVYASVLGIADQNGMLPVYYSKRLSEVFNVSKEITGSAQLMTGRSAAVGEYSAFMFDETFDSIRTSHSGDVTVVGFFQSWKYFQFVDALVRREFRFLAEHGDPARDFLRNVRKENGLDEDTIYIGVHIRRGDMVSPAAVKQGYSVADDDYLERAVTYVINYLGEQRSNDTPRSLGLVFVVCSDDLVWSREHFNGAVSRAVRTLKGDGVTGEKFHVILVKKVLNVPITDVEKISDERLLSVNITVAYSPPGGQSSERDLAILSQCNHTIMTVGTYGWWAGYLAGGLTVYYKDFPAPGGNLDRWFSKQDFFPPDWIGL